MSDELNTENALPPVTDTVPDKPTGKTFTQDELNSIIADRLKRADEKRTKDLLNELGMDSWDSAKNALQNAKAQADKDLSELDKSKKVSGELSAKLDAMTQALEAEKAARKLDKLHYAVLHAAQDAKAEHPQDVLLWFKENKADQLDKLFDAEGAIDDKAVATFVTALKKERPNWFKIGGVGSPSNADGKPQPPDLKKVLGDKPLIRL